MESDSGQMLIDCPQIHFCQPPLPVLYFQVNVSNNNSQLNKQAKNQCKLIPYTYRVALFRSHNQTGQLFFPDGMEK